MPRLLGCETEARTPGTNCSMRLSSATISCWLRARSSQGASRRIRKPELVFEPKPEIEKIPSTSPDCRSGAISSSIFCIWVRVKSRLTVAGALTRMAMVERSSAGVSSCRTVPKAT